MSATVEGNGSETMVRRLAVALTGLLAGGAIAFRTDAGGIMGVVTDSLGARAKASRKDISPGALRLLTGEKAKTSAVGPFDDEAVAEGLFGGVEGVRYDGLPREEIALLVSGHSATAASPPTTLRRSPQQVTWSRPITARRTLAWPTSSATFGPMPPCSIAARCAARS